MDPWPILWEALGWVLLAVLVLFVVLVVWSFIAVAVKRARRSRSHTILKSPGK